MARISLPPLLDGSRVIVAYNAVKSKGNLCISPKEGSLQAPLSFIAILGFGELAAISIGATLPNCFATVATLRPVGKRQTVQ